MTQEFSHEDEEAALWVARHMSNAVDASAFAAWLDGGADRRARFDALWSTCMDDAVTDGLRLSEEHARLRYEDAEAAAPSDVPHHWVWRHTRLFGAVAAMLVVMLVFAWPRSDASEQTFATAAGEIREVALADGSTIMLNGASRIETRLTQQRREIRLEAGEALFDVAHDPERPFSVTAGEGRVTVLGTRFNLALNNQRVDLEVERGQVRFEPIAHTDRAVLVGAAYRASLAGGTVSAPSMTNGANAAPWQLGWLQVSNMPLGEIISRLERWTDKPIRVEDPALLRIPAAGRFRLSEPGIVLESLGALHAFTVTENADAFVLSKR